MKIKIIKFGGTSLGNADSIAVAADIVRDVAHAYVPVVVVSALGGVTDELVRCIELAKDQKPRRIAGALNTLEERHKEALRPFVADDRADEIWEKEFAPLFKRLRYILTGISYVGELADKSYAVICSFGERFSSRIMYHALRARDVDACRISSIRLVRTDSHYTEAHVDMKRTRINFRRIVLPALRKERVPVIEGFIGKDGSGDVTLLGRGGSDFTASIAAVSLDAEAIEIWTDVDGIMSADPRAVPRPRVWDRVDIGVMAEMAYGGAKVLHPKTIVPAIQRNIPVYIKNTMNTKAPGTEVVTDGERGLRGVVVDKDQMLIHLTNADMLDHVGFIHRASEICADHGVSIDVCATSEISFTVSIRGSDYTPKLKKELEKIARVEMADNVAKLCVIGKEISGDGTLLSSIFRDMAPHPIHAVSSGSSYNNITLIVSRDGVDEALRRLHDSLFS